MHLLSTLTTLTLSLLLFTPQTIIAHGPSSKGQCQKFQKPRYQTLPPIAFPPADHAGEQRAKCPNGMEIIFSKHGGKDGKGLLVFDSENLPIRRYGMIGYVEFELKNQTELKHDKIQNKGFRATYDTAYASHVENGEWCERPWWHVRRATTLTCYKRINNGKKLKEN